MNEKNLDGYSCVVVNRTLLRFVSLVVFDIFFLARSQPSSIHKVSHKPSPDQSVFG